MPFFNKLSIWSGFRPTPRAHSRLHVPQEPPQWHDRRKPSRLPGQETTQPQDATGAALAGVGISGEQLATSEAPTVDPEAIALANRNAILATINEQGAAIIARFESLGFSDLTDQSLTDNLDFLNLVRKATEATTGSAGATVTNEEGKPQPVRGAPVLTEHGWHVPG